MASPLQEIALAHARTLQTVEECWQEQHHWINQPELLDAAAQHEINHLTAANYARLALVIRSWHTTLEVLTRADTAARQVGINAQRRAAAV